MKTNFLLLWIYCQVTAAFAFTMLPPIHGYGPFLLDATALAAGSMSEEEAFAPVATQITTHAPNVLSATPVCVYYQVTIATTHTGPPRQAIFVEDLTRTTEHLLHKSKLQQGVVHVTSRHTTTAITINEQESRLAKDVAMVLLQLIPPDERSPSDQATDGTRYAHNDLEQRPESPEEAQRCRDNGWNIDNAEILKAWRNQEPINAHSHLLSMLLGSSESIPVVDGKMVIGQWQSILLVDLDGPRDRTVGIQFMGYQ